MATYTGPDGTKLEAKHITLEYPDGTKVTGTDKDFDIDQDGPSVSIRIGQGIIMKIVSSGKLSEQLLTAVFISPDLQELARVAVDLCVQLRGGDYLMRFEGQIIDW